MSAVIYLLVRQYINRIRRMFRKPLYAVLTVLIVLFILIGPVMMIINPYKGLVGKESREIVIAGIQLFIGVTLIISALSQQGGLFSYAEASILFCAPFDKRTILLYSTVQTLPASFLTAIFMCFYFPFVIGSDMTPIKLVATLFVMSLLVFCIYILYYYIYIQDIGHPGLKACLKKVAWSIFAVIVVLFAAIWLKNGFDFEAAMFSFFTGPIYNAIPIFGWAKWAIAAMLNNQYLTGFVPATLLLVCASYLLARLYYSTHVDFFEKAQLDSIRLQQVMDNLKNNGYDASGLSIKKVRRVKEEFKPGAGAIMSRQLLEMKKKGPMITFKDFMNGAIYIAIGLAAGLDFKIVFAMMLFSMISNTTSDGWNAELKKPYIFLIPESSIKKLLYAVLPGFVKTLLSGLIVVLVATLLFGVSISDAVCYLLLLTSYTVLFTAAGVSTYRIVGGIANAIVLIIMRVLFVMLSVIPGALLAAILYIATSTLDLPTAISVIVIVNILCSALFIFLSRRILEHSELI